MIAPKPNNPPTTLAALYERETGAQADEDEIRALLEGLPKRRKQVLSLYLKGYSYQQIADALSSGRKKPMSKGTVHSRIKFAMRKVYRILTQDQERWNRGDYFRQWKEQRKGKEK